MMMSAPRASSMAIADSGEKNSMLPLSSFLKVTPSSVI
jgi:hypothetical protein